MQEPVEIRYAGVVVGVTPNVRDVSPDGLEFFLGVPDPMPVGTVVEIRIGDRAARAKVERVTESPDAAVAGMRLGFLDAGARSLLGRPAEAAPVAAVAPSPEPVAPQATPVEAVRDDEHTRPLFGEPGAPDATMPDTLTRPLYGTAPEPRSPESSPPVADSPPAEAPAPAVAQDSISSAVESALERAAGAEPTDAPAVPVPAAPDPPSGRTKKGKRRRR